MDVYCDSALAAELEAILPDSDPTAGRLRNRTLWTFFVPGHGAIAFDELEAGRLRQDRRPARAPDRSGVDRRRGHQHTSYPLTSHMAATAPNSSPRAVVNVCAASGTIWSSVTTPVIGPIIAPTP